MARRPTVLDFISRIGAASDPIPVKIRRGTYVIEEAESLYWLAYNGSPGTLESKLTYATIKRDCIILHTK